MLEEKLLRLEGGLERVEIYMKPSPALPRMDVHYLLLQI